jgi:hypothetical protein
MLGDVSPQLMLKEKLYTFANTVPNHIICEECNKDAESSGPVHKVHSALTTSNL